LRFNLPGPGNLHWGRGPPGNGRRISGLTPTNPGRYTPPACSKRRATSGQLTTFHQAAR
jgi:hypothetical protein